MSGEGYVVDILNNSAETSETHDVCRIPSGSVEWRKVVVVHWAYSSSRRFIQISDLGVIRNGTQQA